MYFRSKAQYRNVRCNCAPLVNWPSLAAHIEHAQRQEEDDVSSESEKENEDTEIEEVAKFHVEDAVNLDDHCTETTSTKRKKLWNLLSFKDLYRIYFLSSSVTTKTARRFFFGQSKLSRTSSAAHLVQKENTNVNALLLSEQRIYRFLTRSTTL
ncbi:unnamed protein product [Caenorhabditis sp. 36 PRJEB53466]|nr:unnamed protein product [Caenorhabditis sp. 36 PRJEB53466]